MKCRLFWLAAMQQDYGPQRFCNFFENQPENVSITMTKIKEKSVQTCFKKCPRSCERNHVKVTVESEDRIPTSFYDSQSHIIHSTDQNMSMTIISVSHDAVRQSGILVTKEVKTYTFTELMNNVGGILGLFVGSTLMTVVQIVLSFIGYCCERRKCKTVVIQPISKA